LTLLERADRPLTEQALSLAPGAPLDLDVAGPSARAAGDLADNLVLKAAHALQERVEGLRVGRFGLTKRLPVAAGLGGGSADAAAALRLLARLNGLADDDKRLLDAAAACGSDIPVCVGSTARVMRGRGEVLSPAVGIPPIAGVLVNPRVAVPTRDVFAAIGLTPGDEGPSRKADVPSAFADSTGLFAYLDTHGNDLEAPAIAREPVIAETLALLRRLGGVRVVRMSGSGATCFALCDDLAAADRAAAAVRAMRPDWWIASGAFR